MGPTTSCAGTLGSFSPGYMPVIVAASVWQTPHASTRIRAWPAPGSETGRSTTRSVPGAETSTALYVFFIFVRLSLAFHRPVLRLRLLWMYHSFVYASLLYFIPAERQARHCHVDSLSLFLSPSIRECRERSSQASSHPLRNPRKSAARSDRLHQRLSNLKRCRASLFGVLKHSSPRLA